MEEFWQYIEDIKSGKTLAGDYVKLAVKRFENDYEKSLNDSNYPFYFDEEKAEKFIKFSECLKLYKDKWANKPLRYEPWQKFILCQIYGWCEKKTGKRRFTKAFIFVARKNGKTVMVSTCLLYDLLTTAGAECYCAATKREQSKIAFDNCKEMVKKNKGLSSRLDIYKSSSRIVYERTASKLEALSSDYDSMDGLNPSCVIVDECSAMKDYNIVKVLQSGMYARPEPLMIEITSGSDDMYSVGRQEYERSAKILQGSIEADDYFCILYTLDKNDDWKDPKNYIKANPNLGVSIQLDALIKARDEAIQNPSLEGEFRTKNLGQFVSPISVWIDYKTWDKCVKNARTYPFPSDEELKKCVCVGAVDLAERLDMTAYTLYFYDPSTKKYYARHRIYFPEEQLQAKMKKDSPMMLKWIEEGYVKMTPGSITNYGMMFKDILDDASKYQIREIAYDPYNSVSLINEIGPYIDLVEVAQNMKNISPMSKDWEGAVVNGDIVDDNPVMKWMVSNCKIKTDLDGNIKPIKDAASNTSSKRIDCVITSLMAHGRIKALLEEGIDTRTAEEIQADMEKLLESIPY